MPYRGPKAFPIFVDVLKEDYEWLADDLEEALTLKTEDVTDEVEADELIGTHCSKSSFLSKNSILISRENCRFFWEKNS